MVNLTHINKTKKAYPDSENNLLFLGIFKDKKLNPQQRTLDNTLNNRLSAAMKLDGFTGKKDEQIHIFGNDSNKRVVLIGLGTQKNYTSDRARSVASNITRFSTDVKNSDFSVDGDSFSLKKNIFAQAFAEGLVLGSYEFNDYKTKKDDSIKASSITMYGKVDAKTLDKGAILGASVGFARDLGNHPANILSLIHI